MGVGGWVGGCLVFYVGRVLPRLGVHLRRGIAATRQLAKRQITWLRSMPQRRVVDCQAEDATEQVLRAVETLMAEEGSAQYAEQTFGL